MKRIWIALGLLLMLFASTLLHSAQVNVLSHDIAALLGEAESNAEQGDWNGAKALTQTARQKWDEWDGYLHITLRHSETDAIYTSFREVAEFIECRESGEYSAANARLIAALELLAEAEQLTAKNIL